MKAVTTYTLSLCFLLTAALSATGQDLNKNEAGYKVVINHEEQYSIWPVGRKAMQGWKDTGTSGDRRMCQKYIEEVWTDMRPLSVQKMRLPADTRYKVVINHEEQYSVIPEKSTTPKGWKDTGKAGSLADCTRHIKSVWTDMRPLSLRRR